MKKKTFDLIVIGTGSSGITVASRCRAAGWSVAIIDSRPYGGTCALRGCDPKKMLVGAAEVVDWAHRMEGKGIVAKGIKIDWQKLIQFKNSFTGPVPKKREKMFADMGIAMFHGVAHFVDTNKVQVGKDTLQGKHLLIATGAMPRKLNIEGEQYLSKSDQFLDLKKLPKKIVFIGGGFVSFEFAHIARRAGADVTILHKDKQPLRAFEKDIVNVLVKATRSIGIKLVLNTSVTSIEKKNKKYIVHSSGKKTYTADLVVHGAGRVPEIEALDLKKANIKHEKRGISVNKYLQSISNPLVYAAGDAAASGGFPLTPIASMEGRVVADNLLNGNKATPDQRAVATAVFTIPPLASVGLTEQQAKEKNLKYRVNSNYDTSWWYSSRRIASKYSAYKVIIEEKTDRILGAHLFGAHSEEVINIFAMAIKHKITADDVKALRMAYPSHSDDIGSMV